MTARLSRNVPRRREDLLFATDLFPSVAGEAKGQESSCFYDYYVKKKSMLYKVPMFQQMLLSYNVAL